MQEEQNNVSKKETNSSSKPVLNTARIKWKSQQSKDEIETRGNERLREVLYKLAYKQLSPGEWNKLAQHWAFTAEQIRAIEHQYTGKQFDLLAKSVSKY